MNRFLCIILLITMGGCGYSGLEKDALVENEVIGLRGEKFDDGICEVCNAFNDAFPTYTGTMKKGLSDYKKNGGCCEKCFEKDFAVEWEKHAGVKDEQIVRVFKAMERYGGQMIHGDCEAFFLDKRLSTTINTVLTRLHNVVYDVVNSPNKSKCDEHETDNPDDGHHGGASGGELIKFDMKAYADVLKEKTAWLLADIGGEVEERWLQFGYDLNLLKICYALNSEKVIDIERDNIDGRVGVLVGGDGNPYIVTAVYLYRYLNSFREPELLTLTELNEQTEVGIVIAKESAEAEFDDLDGFVDVWDGSNFMSEKITTSMKFYFYRVK